jgi:threonine dehydratase
MNVRKEVLHAKERIRSYVRQTTLGYSLYLSQLADAEVFCKMENLQHTGSFKVRGAMNKLLSMPEEKREMGVVAASTGNHGLAVAYGLDVLNAAGTIFVPANANNSKVEAIKRLGAEVHYFGNDTAETETHARRYAKQHNMTYVSPYNDLKVIGGQGTIGVELIRQLSQIDVVFISLGGGGMISGIAGYLKAIQPYVQIIGCSPENSQVMIQSVNEGEILDLPSRPTLSDATAGGIEAGSITFDLCRKLVDEYVTVTEDEIGEALRLFIEAHHTLIEGAAAVAVASYLKTREQFVDANVVIIICGANIDRMTLKKVL